MDTNIIGSSGGSLTVGTDKFNGIYMASSNWGTAITTQNVMPVAGTLKNFYINCDAGPGAATSRTFAIYKNGADTSLSITLTGAGTGAGISTGNDTSHSVTFAANDLISIHSTATSGTTSAGTVRWTLAATCSTNVSMILGSSGSAMGTAFPVYVALQGIDNDVTSSSFVEEVLPTAGTIKNAYVQLNNSATANMTFTLVQNGVDTSLVVPVNSGFTFGIDTNAAHTVTAAAGDRFYWRVNATGAASRTAFVSVQFSPTINGESVHMYGGARAQVITASRFQTLTNNGGGTYSATESSVQQLTQAAVWQKLYVYEPFAITSGSYQYAFTVNGFSTLPTVTISSGQTGSDTTSARSTLVANAVSMNVTPSGSPTSSNVEWGIVSYIAPPQTKTALLGLLGVG